MLETSYLQNNSKADSPHFIDKNTLASCESFWESLTMFITTDDWVLEYYTVFENKKETKIYWTLDSQPGTISEDIYLIISLALFIFVLFL